MFLAFLFVEKLARRSAVACVGSSVSSSSRKLRLSTRQRLHRNASAPHPSHQINERRRHTSLSSSSILLHPPAPPPTAESPDNLGLAINGVDVPFHSIVSTFRSAAVRFVCCGKGKRSARGWFEAEEEAEEAGVRLGGRI